MWDERYATDEYRFGTNPNRFLINCAAGLKPGRLLSLGEGEGRNAVYMASLGFEVTAVDQSAVGLAKAQRLAAERGVPLTTVTADLNDYVIQRGAWDVIMNFFCHMPRPERLPLHRRVVEGLKRGGAYILEIFRPGQLRLATGGPRTRDLVLSLADARAELAGLQFEIARSLLRHEEDDDPSTKLLAIIQVLAIKPDSPTNSR